MISTRLDPKKVEIWKLMKILSLVVTLSCLCLLSGNSLHAGGEGWTSNFEAAKKQAAAEKKSLLIDFTGSDWCGWCIKLNKEVFAHDAFKNGVKDKFILVELDFPRDKSKITEEIAKQNEALQAEYSVQGFPTILIADEKGRPFARTGYKEGGPEVYVTHLNELLTVRQKRDAGFSEAAKAEGVAKAKALVDILKSLQIDEEMLVKFYAEEIEAIKAADPKDETGYAKAANTKKAFVEFQEKLNGLATKGDFEGVLKIIDESIATNEFEGELKQQTLIFKAITFMQLEKPQDALKSLDDAKAVAPEGEIAGHIDGLKKRIEASIQK